MLPKTLGGILRSARQENNISLRELARRVQISAPYLSDIELGKRTPAKPVLSRLAEQLSLSEKDLAKLDTKASVGEFAHFLNESPELAFAFRRTVENLRSGAMTPKALADSLDESLD